MILLVIGLAIFLAIHSLRIFSPDARSTLVARFGEKGWRSIHSLVSLVALVLLAYGFGEARAYTPVLWYPPVWTRHVALMLMMPAMICLVASLIPAGWIRTKTKFPLLVAVKVWAFSHLIANGELSCLLLFGAFLAWAVVLRIVLKRAVARGDVALPVFVSARYDAIAVVVGLGLWAWMIFGLHAWLIGVPPRVF